MPTARQLSLRIVITILLVAIGLLVMFLPYLVKWRRTPIATVPAVFSDSAAVRDGTPAPDSGAVMSALSRVMDPEIGVSIVDLGLVDSLRIDSSGSVSVAVALTTPECPAIGRIGEEAAKAVIAVPGTRRVTVRLDPALVWDPTCISPEARELYRKRFGRP